VEDRGATINRAKSTISICPLWFHRKRATPQQTSLGSVERWILPLTASCRHLLVLAPIHWPPLIGRELDDSVGRNIGSRGLTHIQSSRRVQGGVPYSGRKTPHSEKGTRPRKLIAVANSPYLQPRKSPHTLLCKGSGFQSLTEPYWI
jgi:hypothetical protein